MEGLVGGCEWVDVVETRIIQPADRPAFKGQWVDACITYTYTTAHVHLDHAADVLEGVELQGELLRDARVVDEPDLG